MLSFLLSPWPASLHSLVRDKHPSLLDGPYSPPTFHDEGWRINFKKEQLLFVGFFLNVFIFQNIQFIYTFISQL